MAERSVQGRVQGVPHCGLARAYVIYGPAGLMVVDVGSVGAAGDAAAFIEKGMRRSLDEVRFVLITHFHIDHIGGIGPFIDRCPPEAKILLHPLVGDYIRGQKKLSPINHWLTGLVPASLLSLRYCRKPSHFRYAGLAGIPLPGLRGRALPVARDRIVFLPKGPDRGIPIGFDEWEMIATPGHTEDSVSYYHPASRELICGDFILNMGKDGRGQLNRFCWSQEVLSASYRSLCGQIAPLAIYPGHGEVIRDEYNALRLVNTFSESDKGNPL